MVTPNVFQVSLWVFDKKNLERYPKKTQEAVLSLLRKEVQTLTRIVHPKVLKIFGYIWTLTLHCSHCKICSPLMEARGVLVFESEPVFASLRNVLK